MITFVIINSYINMYRQSKLDPYSPYISENGILFRSDCMDFLSVIRTDSVDTIFVDPPFNLGKVYEAENFNDNLDIESYRKWCRGWLIELVRVLRPGGALFVYHWPYWLMDLGSWLNTLPTLTYRSWIAINMKTGFPIKNRIHPAHYGMLYYTKVGDKPTFNVVRYKTPTCRHCGKEIRDYGGYRDKFKKYEDENGVPWIQISDFWDDTRPARQDKSRKIQINELPLQIPERAILMSTNPGDIVLDCFAGGGSTIHAAQNHGRLWLGNDLGDVGAILERIAAVKGTEENFNLNAKLRDSFYNGFIDKTIVNSKKEKNRPIKGINVDDSYFNDKEKFLSRSKVLGI